MLSYLKTIIQTANLWVLLYLLGMQSCHLQIILHFQLL